MFEALSRKAGKEEESASRMPLSTGSKKQENKQEKARRSRGRSASAASKAKMKISMISVQEQMKDQSRSSQDMDHLITCLLWPKRGKKIEEEEEEVGDSKLTISLKSAIVQPLYVPEPEAVSSGSQFS